MIEIFFVWDRWKKKRLEMTSGQKIKNCIVIAIKEEIKTSIRLV